MKSRFAKTADVCVVVLVPGMGDDVQTMKAGIMEIGDVLAINKADRDGVLRTEKELESLLSFGPRADQWEPPIVKTVAIENKGIEELAAAIERSGNFKDSLRLRVSDERRLRAGGYLSYCASVWLRKRSPAIRHSTNSIV